MFDLVMSTLAGQKVLKQEKNRNLWSPNVKHFVDSLHGEEGDVGKERYFSTKEMFLEYIESDSGRM